MPVDHRGCLLFPCTVHSSFTTVYQVDRVVPSALEGPELAHGGGRAWTPFRARAATSAAALAATSAAALAATSAGTAAVRGVIAVRTKAASKVGPYESKASRGFTMLEVLLSIAIIGLLAGVLVAGSAHLLREQPGSAQEIFWKAVQEARKTALKAEHDIRLKFDKDKKQFVLIDGLAPTTLSATSFAPEEIALKQFPIFTAPGTDLAVDFLPPSTKGGGNLILVGGVAIETQAMAFATFYADGTCSPFRVQFVRDGATSTPLVIDPWTCAPMLPAVDPNAPPPP